MSAVLVFQNWQGLRKVRTKIKTILILVGFMGLFVLCLSTLKTWNDAYIYVPYGMRSVPKYTDIKMFECSWCHRKKLLNRHHIIPQSANPALKDEYTNIVVLCRDCHFVLGHRCNWKRFNPDVQIIVETFTNNLLSAEYFEQIK